MRAGPADRRGLPALVPAPDFEQVIHARLRVRIEQHKEVAALRDVGLNPFLLFLGDGASGPATIKTSVLPGTDGSCSSVTVPTS